MGLRSQDVTVQVPSALAGLTAGFEKEPGGPPPRNTPIKRFRIFRPAWGVALHTRSQHTHRKVRSGVQPDRRHKARVFSRERRGLRNTGKEKPSTISTAWLHASRRLHLPPIQRVVYPRSYPLSR